jgi:hypothetical protein
MDKDALCQLAKLMMSDEDLLRLANGQVETIKEIISKGTDGILPVMSIVCVNSSSKKKSIQVVGLADLPDDSEGRHAAMRKVAAMFASKHEIPVGVSFASEAWKKTLNESEAHRAKHVGLAPPSKCPDKKEIVQVSALSMSKFGAMFFADISRDDNKIVLDGDFEGGPQDKFDGFRFLLLESFFSGVLGQIMENIKE